MNLDNKNFDKDKYCKTAFTLAEALITLAVVGIVAVFAITVFIPKVQEKIRASQISSAKVKFTKAMEVMMINSEVGPYYRNTKEFVDTLQKYLKVAKVCDSEHLQDCFGYDTIILDDEDEMELSWFTDGQIMSLTKESTKSNFGGDTVGLVTVDGTTMLIAWNKKCPSLELGVYEWNNDTNASTNCVAIIMDINGNKGPNRKNDDVATLNAKLGCGVKFQLGNTKYCWDEPFAPTPLTDDDCAQHKSQYGISNCVPTDDEQYSNKDYWGGAMKQCKEQGKRLPNRAELLAFAQYIYGTDEILASGTTEGLTLIDDNLQNASSALATNYQSRNKVFYLWSGVESSKLRAYYRHFYPTSTGYYDANRYYSTRLGVCVP